jgi:hypothetical protein
VTKTFHFWEIHFASFNFIGPPRVLKVGALTGGESEEECERWVGNFLVEDDFKIYGSL